MLNILNIIIFIFYCFMPTTSFSAVHVNGYFKSNGTYVQPYYRSDPNGNVYDNWSTKGNVNPYTGKAGTKNPYPNGTNFAPGSASINGQECSPGYRALEE